MDVSEIILANLMGAGSPERFKVQSSKSAPQLGTRNPEQPSDAGMMKFGWALSVGGRETFGASTDVRIGTSEIIGFTALRFKKALRSRESGTAVLD